MDSLGSGLGPVPASAQWEPFPDQLICGEAQCWRLLGPDFSARCCLYTSSGVGSVRMYPGCLACWHNTNLSFGSCCGDPTEALECGAHPSASVGHWAAESSWPPSAGDIWSQLNNSIAELRLRPSLSGGVGDARLGIETPPRADTSRRYSLYEILLLRDLLWNDVLDTEVWEKYASVEVLSRWLALQPECLWLTAVQRLAELSVGVLDKLTSPTCAEFQLSKAIQHLKVAGKWQDAEELFKDSVQLRLPLLSGWPYESGDEAHLVRWAPDVLPQTPQRWVEGLSSKKWWTDDPFLKPLATSLEQAFDAIYEDLAILTQTRESVEDFFQSMTDAYADFKRHGTWATVKFFDCGDGWSPKGCALFPSVCMGLRGQQFLPSESWPELCAMGFWESVQLLAVMPGTSAPLHSTSNSMVNVQLGVAGLEGAELHLGGEVVSWAPGKVIAWLDSFEHAVEHHGGKIRWVLTIQTLRPELRGNGAPARFAGGLGAQGLLGSVAATPAQPVELLEERAERMATWKRAKLEMLWKAGGVLRELVFTF